MSSKEAKEMLKLRKMFEKPLSLKEINNTFFELTGIISFFDSGNEKEDFIAYLKKENLQEEISDEYQKGREWGDIQTPLSLVNKIYSVLNFLGINPTIVFEPTSGNGNFILNIKRNFPDIEQIYCLDIQRKRKWNFGIKSLHQKNRNTMKMPIIEYRINDIFNDDFADNLSISKDDYLLIIGNPPWVTNTELTKLNSNNRPERKNIRELNGLDALTGKSNFDIAESIIYRLISKFNNHIGKVALLCKNTVIKNLVKDQKIKNISNFKAFKINARKEFGKTCNASLLTFDLGLNSNKSYCEIFNIDNPTKIIRKFGWYKNKFVANLTKYMKIKEFDGSSNFEWRHGIKHDCSKVLILEKDSEQRYHNRLGEIVEIEEKFLYPFLKGSDLKEFEVNTSERKIILTQNKLNEDTNKIKIQASKTWNYLLSNEEYFSKRKSSIFNKKIKFAVFGVGDYIFSPYKIAIASMYKKANFSLVNTINNRPVLFDDTCYFLGFEKYATALYICTVLNSDITNNLLDAIVFRDSKRPYTKEVLMRINILKILENITFSEIKKIWQDNNYSNSSNYSEKEYKKVKKELSQKINGN